MRASVAIGRQLRSLGVSEATPLDLPSEQFKSLQRAFHHSPPGRPEAIDLPEAGNTDIVIEDIFRIFHTEMLAGFGGVEIRERQPAALRAPPRATFAS
jgi:hypothetical protein